MHTIMKKKDKELHLLYSKTKSCTYYIAFKTELKKPKTIAIHHFTYSSKTLYSFLGGVLLKKE